MRCFCKFRENLFFFFFLLRLEEDITGSSSLSKLFVLEHLVSFDETPLS